MSSASSKAPSASTAPSSNATIGDIVYLRDGKTKHHPRDRFLVVDKDSSWLYIRKFVGSQFRQASYKVKSEEIFRVPEYNLPSAYHKPSHDTESDGENDCNDSSQVLDGRNDDSNDSTLVLKENRVEPNEESVTNENESAALDFTPVVHCDMESIPNDNGNEPYPLEEITSQPDNQPQPEPQLVQVSPRLSLKPFSPGMA